MCIIPIFRPVRRVSRDGCAEYLLTASLREDERVTVS
jgi:hypothetical protein